MSGKLDQSLDEILSTRPKNTNRRGRARRATQPGRAAAVAAPVNGIKKNTTQARGGKTAPTGPASRQAEGVITVSNLPKDVNEAQIKEYFVKSVGPIKRVELSYGPNGASRGEAKIIFVRPESATKALKELNGLLVDGRPMTIRMIVDARNAPTVQAPKGLGDRIQPKAQPKSAATTKATANGSKTAERGGRGRGRGGRGGRSSRPTKKTAEELDSEMADYFDGGAAATSTDAEPAAVNGAVATDDAMGEVL